MLCQQITQFHLTNYSILAALLNNSATQDFGKMTYFQEQDFGKTA